MFQYCNCVINYMKNKQILCFFVFNGIVAKVINLFDRAFRYQLLNN